MVDALSRLFGKGHKKSNQLPSPGGGESSSGGENDGDFTLIGNTRAEEAGASAAAMAYAHNPPSYHAAVKNSPGGGYQVSYPPVALGTSSPRVGEDSNKEHEHTSFSSPTPPANMLEGVPFDFSPHCLAAISGTERTSDNLESVINKVKSLNWVHASDYNFRLEKSVISSSEQNQENFHHH